MTPKTTRTTTTSCGLGPRHPIPRDRFRRGGAMSWTPVTVNHGPEREAEAEERLDLCDGHCRTHHPRLAMETSHSGSDYNSDHPGERSASAELLQPSPSLRQHLKLGQHRNGLCESPSWFNGAANMGDRARESGDSDAARWFTDLMRRIRQPLGDRSLRLRTFFAVRPFGDDARRCDRIGAEDRRPERRFHARGRHPSHTPPRRHSQRCNPDGGGWIQRRQDPRRLDYARQAGFTEATGLGQDRLTEAGRGRATARSTGFGS